MRIQLLTALVLTAVPTAIHAQQSTPAAASAEAVTISAPNNIQTEPAPEDPMAIEAGPAPAYQPGQNYLIQSLGGTAEAAGPLIMFDQQDSKAMDEMAEDLNIFGFILKRNLEKALGEQLPEMRMGVPMLLESGGRHIHASYIEGFGALLNLRVTAPVVAPPASDAKSAPPKEPTEWEKARAALYGGEAAAQAQWSRANARTAEHYNPKVVETLKKQVIESLKSAGNLRHVKPDEWIVVTITGGPNGVDAQAGGAGNNGSGSISGLVGTRAWRHSGRPTMMTFRVKKSTVEALASKGSSDEQFAGKVEVTAYLGAEATSGTEGGAGYSVSTLPIGGSSAFGILPRSQ
jgi:hypothetical protein